MAAVQCDGALGHAPRATRRGRCGWVPVRCGCCGLTAEHLPVGLSTLGAALRSLSASIARTYAHLRGGASRMLEAH